MSKTAKELLTTAGLQDTHWGERIIAAEDAGRTVPTQEELRDSAEWMTCACGMQDPRIPRDKEGRPNDTELRELGGQFYGCWFEPTEFVKAAQTLIAIEKRAGEVLAEVLS